MSSVDVTRSEAAWLLKTVLKLKLPLAEDVRRWGQLEYLLPTGAKLKVGREKRRLSYRLAGYLDAGGDLWEYLRLLAERRTP